MKRKIILLIFIFYLLNIYAKDATTLKAKIKARQFYRETETIVLDGSISEYPKNRKISFLWEIKDSENNNLPLNSNNQDKIELNLKEGKYTVFLTISLNKKEKSTTDFTFYVAAKEMVNVTFKIFPPPDTNEEDTIFLAHEVPEHKEWVPYATTLKKDSNGYWSATLTLKTGRNFKFQPTRGNWGSKARDNNNNDLVVTYIPYRDEEVIVKDFSWGRVFDDKTLLREPLLVPMSEDFLNYKILWNNNKDRLFYGSNEKDEIEAKVIKYEYGYETILPNLKPATSYYFKLGEDGEKIKFKTPDNKEGITFIAISDSQNKPKVIEDGAKKIFNYNPDFIVSAGDNVNDGFKAFSWDLTFFTPFVPNIKGIPFITAMGNHEEESPLIKRYLGLERYYNTYLYKNLRIITLDTQTSFLKGSKQYEFIENTLKNNKSKWIIVVMHDSLYSYVPRHYSNLMAREILAPLFEKYRVDLVISGHNHVYERTKKINGIIYITLPSFGSNKPSKTGDEKDINSELQVFDMDGFAIININNNQIRVKVEDITGKEIDSFIITK